MLRIGSLMLGSLPKHDAFRQRLVTKDCGLWIQGCFPVSWLADVRSVVAIALAALTSLLIGLGETVSARETRATRAVEITVAYFASGLVLVALGLMTGVIPSTWDEADVAYGAVSGLFNGFALILLYLAYTESSVGIALPITGMVSVVAPVAVDLAINGSAVSSLLIAGVVIGTLSLGLTSFSPDLKGKILKGVALAAGSGFCYGAMLILLAETSSESGLWPVLPQRMVSLIVAVTMARLTGSRALPIRGARRLPATAGLFGSAGLITFALAAQRGSLSAVSVVGSQYAAVAIVAGYLLEGTKVRWWQVVGLVGTIVGLTLIIIG